MILFLKITLYEIEIRNISDWDCQPDRLVLISTTAMSMPWSQTVIVADEFYAFLDQVDRYSMLIGRSESLLDKDSTDVSAESLKWLGSQPEP